MTDEVRTEYHYVITIEWLWGPMDGRRATAEGTLEFDSGRTRQAAYLEILERTRVRNEIPDEVGAITTYFSLEPNRLG